MYSAGVTWDCPTTSQRLPDPGAAGTPCSPTSLNRTPCPTTPRPTRGTRSPNRSVPPLPTTRLLPPSQHRSPREVASDLPPGGLHKLRQLVTGNPWLRISVSPAATIRRDGRPLTDRLSRGPLQQSLWHRRDMKIGQWNRFARKPATTKAGSGRHGAGRMNPNAAKRAAAKKAVVRLSEGKMALASGVADEAAGVAADDAGKATAPQQGSEAPTLFRRRASRVATGHSGLLHGCRDRPTTPQREKPGETNSTPTSTNRVSRLQTRMRKPGPAETMKARATAASDLADGVGAAGAVAAVPAARRAILRLRATASDSPHHRKKTPTKSRCQQVMGAGQPPAATGVAAAERLPSPASRAVMEKNEAVVGVAAGGPSGKGARAAALAQANAARLPAAVREAPGRAAIDLPAIGLPAVGIVVGETTPPVHPVVAATTSPQWRAATTRTTKGLSSSVLKRQHGGANPGPVLSKMTACWLKAACRACLTCRAGWRRLASSSPTTSRLAPVPAEARLAGLTEATAGRMRFNSERGVTPGVFRYASVRGLVRLAPTPPRQERCYFSAIVRASGRRIWSTTHISTTSRASFVSRSSAST